MLGAGATIPLGAGSGGSGSGSSGFVGRDIIWVDLRFAGGIGNNGTDELPYNTANIGLGAVPDGGTLMLAGGDASTEAGVNIGARSFTTRGLSGQSGFGGLTAVLPTLTYAITTGTQRLAFQNVSVALVHSGTVSSLTSCYFEFCPTVTLTAGGDSTAVFWVGDAACTLSGSGGAAYLQGGNIAGYVANTGSVTVRGANVTGNVTSATAVLFVGGCTFSAVSVTAPSITLDPASYKNATAAGVTFSSTAQVLIAFGTPVDIGTANAQGTDQLVARRDHVHNLPFSAVNTALAAANATININGQKITGSGAPTSSTDLVTKSYADAIAVGLKVKTAAVAVATANQATMSGTAQTIDGVALNTVGQRVLLTAQTTATQNGLWVIAAGAWTRPTDFATGSGAAQSYVPITGGTTWAGSSYFDTNTAGTDVVDTNNLTWTLFSQAAIVTAGAGLTKTGNTLDVVAGDATIVVHADDLVVGVIGNANLADNTIALARLANATAQYDFIGRNTAGSGPWERMTLAQAQTALGITTGGALKAVRAATTANITLSGTQTVDGVALVAGDRCLVKNQTTGSQNGVYAVAAGAWARSSDLSSSSQAFGGLMVPVSEGTANGNRVAILTTDDPITIATTSLTFAMDRIIPAASVAPQDVTNGAAQIGTSSDGARADHVHTLTFTVVAAILAAASAAISVNSQKITNLANGTVSADAVNIGQLTSAISTAIGAPASPGDNGKVAYASGGVLAYAAGVTTSAGVNLSVTSTASTGTVASTFKVTDAAHTALTASTERISALFDFGQTRQFATGALTTQRALRILAPTYSFVGASTIATAATVAISGAPAAGTNATITNPLALWLEAGALGLGSALPASGDIRVTYGFALKALGTSSTTYSVIQAAQVSGTDNSVLIGDNTANKVECWVASGGSYAWRVNSVLEYTADATAFNYQGNNAIGAGFFSTSGTVSASGLYRGSGNALLLAGRGTAAPTIDIPAVSVDASDHLVIGGSGTNSPTTNYYNTRAAGLHIFQVNATDICSASSTIFDFKSLVATFGTSPAATGTIRLPNNTAGQITWRNVGGTADVVGIQVDNGDNLVLGDRNNATAVYLDAKTGGFQNFRVNGVTEYVFNAAYADFTDNQIRFGTNPSTTAKINGPAGGSTLLAAQNTANTAAIVCVATDASNQVLIGDATNGANNYIQAAGSTYFKQGSTTFGRMDTSGLLLFNGILTYYPVTCSYVALGSTVAGSGLVRGPNNSTLLAARNNANSGDLSVLAVDSSDQITLGNASSPLFVSSSGNVEIRLGGALIIGAPGGFVGGTGVLNFENNKTIIAAKNAAHSAEIAVLGMDSSNQINIGQSIGCTTFISGSAIKLANVNTGFFGSSGAAKQTVTGSRTGPTGSAAPALTNLLTALAAYGIIADSSTA